MMEPIHPGHIALYTAAHAVAETRLGPPYETICITSEPHWEQPHRPLQWQSPKDATELLIRLSVGFAALRLADCDEKLALALSSNDIEGVGDVVQSLDGARPNQQAVVERALASAMPFLRDADNHRAIDLVKEQLLEYGALSMHEVDFLVDAADGDPEALEDLRRFRATFSKTRIPWPDST